MGTAFVIVWAAVGATVSEPSALITQLGSPRYAQREAAADALEDKGRDALPALRQARDDRDPEVRARAEELVDKIETGLLVRPTLVRLDYRDRPLAEVVKDLARQSSIAVALFPENNPAWQGRKITIQASEPVPFWEALSRVCREGQLHPTTGLQNMGPASRTPAISLIASAQPPPPTSDTGPFRLQIWGIHHHRDRNFGGGGFGSFMGNNGFVAGGPGAGAGASESFTFDLNIMVEPRMTLASQGIMRITEAVDDKGNSLLLTTPATGTVMVRHSGFNGFNAAGQVSMGLQGHLKYPEQPGRTIKRLKGVVPIVVSARKDDPTVVDLALAKGKTFRSGEITLVINDVKPDPNNPRNTLIDLSLRSHAAGDPEGMNRLMMHDLAFRMPNPQGQFDVVDAQGRSYQPLAQVTQRFDQNESRLTYSLAPRPGLGAPSQVRFYDTMKAEVDAVFEFRDVPMP